MGTQTELLLYFNDVVCITQILAPDDRYEGSFMAMIKLYKNKDFSL